MTPHPAGQYAGGRKAEAERNDRLVLAAATQVFLEMGYDAPMSAIAELAGVGMGSLYRRYRSKDDLIRLLCEQAMERMLHGAEVALAEEPDGWTALTRFMTDAVRCGAGALSHMAGRIPVTTALVDLSVRASDAMRAILDQAAADGSVRPGVTSADLTYMCVMLRTPFPGTPERVAELRRRYLTALLDGLRPGPLPLPGRPPEWEEIADRWGDPADG